MDFDLELIISNLPTLVHGATTTLLVSLAAICIGMFGGMGICLCRLSKNRLIKALAIIYIHIFRGVPILVLLLMIYYILPEIGINTPPVIAAIAGLTLNTTAFQAEIYRGGFLSVPVGQVEAAKALGMRSTRIYSHILIPQVLDKVMPSLVNEIIILLKNSSLISVIAVTELMRVSQTLVAASYRPLEIYLTAALMYLVLNLSLACVGRSYSNRNKMVTV